MSIKLPETLENLTGCNLIAAERARQVKEENWTADHDVNVHRKGELALAAACYAIPHGYRLHCAKESIAELWPWCSDWWKPSPVQNTRGRIVELVKAGALIAAELDRLIDKEKREEKAAAKAAKVPDPDAAIVQAARIAELQQENDMLRAKLRAIANSASSAMEV